MDVDKMKVITGATFEMRCRIHALEASLAGDKSTPAFALMQCKSWLQQARIALSMVDAALEDDLSTEVDANDIISSMNTQQGVKRV